MSFKDFPNGLNDLNEYLDARHHISGTTGSGTDSLKVVASAEYSFTLRELLCGMLSGNGLKLPNVQLCMHANINSLLGIPGLQSELHDALTDLMSGVEQFMDHTKLDNVLGRLNGVLGEAQNVANLINFCATPVNPIAIPNMLERAMGSFLGAGKDIIDQIGSIAPENVCACIGPSGFNASVFNGGILGTIANNISAINAGNLGQSVIDSLRADIDSVTGGITSLINFENNINGSYAQGGSQFSTPDSGCNSEIGVLHNANTGGVGGNARLVSQLKSLYDRLGAYPVQYSLGSGAGTTSTGHQYDSNGDRILQGEVIEYPNIFHLLLEDSLLEIIQRDDNPNPTVDNQTPVYDYCGNIIGYTSNFAQRETTTSDGSTPTVPNSPGYNAGGLVTDTSNIASSGSSSGDTTVINNFNNSGNTLFVVGSESAMLSVNAATNDIVVRSDILTIFTRKDTNQFSTGTINDFQQATSTLFDFLNNLNLESGNGLVVKDSGISRARSVIGGSGQIQVTNGDGAGGDIQIALQENTRFPGTAAIKIPAGTTSQRPNTEVGEIRYNTDTHVIEGYFGDTGSWKVIGPNSINFSVQTALNLGSGQQVFKQLNGTELQFRSFTSAGGIALTSNGTEIQITDTITSSNVGSGGQVFKTRNTNNFAFRTLTSTDNSVTITQNTDTVDLSGDPDVRKSDAVQTTDGTAVAVNFHGNTISPANGKTWFFDIRAIGVATSGEKQAFKIEGVVTNVAGSQSIVGTNNKVDYVRSGTADLAQTPWDPMASYNSSDVVEYDLNVYTANNNITGGALSSNLPPDQDATNWTLSYSGWNVTAEVVGGSFSIRVKGTAGKTVNWKLRFTKVEV